MDYKKIIGENLQAARKERKIGQKDIADYFDTGVSTVSSWECGTNSMSADVFIRYCDFLNVSPDTIAGHIPQGIMPSEMDMIRKFRSIPADQQDTILSLLDTIYAKTKKGHTAVSA